MYVHSIYVISQYYYCYSSCDVCTYIYICTLIDGWHWFQVCRPGLVAALHPGRDPQRRRQCGGLGVGVGARRPLAPEIAKEVSRFIYDVGTRLYIRSSDHASYAILGV